jgi:two-component system sensor histidine kinase GlrK
MMIKAWLMSLKIQPTSLRQLVLLSFAMALIPLAVLLVQSQRALTTLSALAVSEAQSSVRAVRRVEEMEKLAIDIERAVRQYEILRTDEPKERGMVTLNNYQVSLQEVCVNQALLQGCEEQQQLLQTLRKFLQTLIDSAVTAKADDTKTESAMDPQLKRFRQIQQTLTATVWDTVDQRLIYQQQRVGKLQQKLAWQSVGLVLLTLILVAWASGKIAKPVERLDKMIRSMGQQQGELKPHHISGPRELVELGERLQWLAERLAQLEALRTSMLRHASHELKTPLASIREGCSLLADEVVGKLSLGQKEVILLLNSSADRLQQLIEQLLDYNRLLQQANPHVQWVEMRPLLEQALEEHALAFNQSRQQVHLECGVSEVWTDPTLFRRILDNLLNNAQAYGEQGGEVWIKLKFVGQELQLKVANTGPPIPMSLRKTIFEPFQRGWTQRFGNTQGSGLGLSIVADCVRMLEGEVEVIDENWVDVCLLVKLPQPEKS